MRRKTKPEIEVDGVTFYSTERAAKVLGVHYRTLMRHVKKGALQVAHVGAAGYIAETELRRLLTEGSGARGPAKPIRSALREVQKAVHTTGARKAAKNPRKSA